MSQAIVTKYKGPTSRDLSATITARTQGSSATVLCRDAAGIGAAHCHAAHALAEKLGWRGTWVGGAMPNATGYAFVLVDHAADVVEVSVPSEVTDKKPRKVRGKYLTKVQAVCRFRVEVMPGVREQYGRFDKPARAEAWSNFTDELCKGGEISLEQYNTWGHP